MKHKLFAIATCILALTGNALADDILFDRVLLPIMTQPISGAFGSLWKSEFVAHNPTQAVIGLALVLRPGCAVCDYPALYGHETHRPIMQYENGAGDSPGLFFYPELPYGAQVQYNLRIRDLSRQASTWGTEIPVVRARDTFTGPLNLLDIPADDRFRQAIRVYDFDARPSAQVLMKVYRIPFSPAIPTTTPLVETTLTLTEPPNNTLYANTVNELKIRPGYAQIGWLLQAFPQITPGEPLRIELTPITPGLRFWAFAAITNNETQHITTITPQ